LEEAGIATVVVGIQAFRHRLAAMTLARTVITPHVLGRTVGPPGDWQRQRLVIATALELLESAAQGGEIVDMAGSYRPEHAIPPA
jgi:hypothetical protein